MLAKRMIILVERLLLVLVLVGCSTAAKLFARPTLLPALTQTPAPSATTQPPTRTIMPSPTAHFVYPTVLPPQPLFPDLTYQPGPLTDVNAYRVQLWLRQGEDFYSTGNILTISSLGAEQTQLDYVIDQQLNLQDVTADGLPELIVNEYSGGAHCCFTTRVFQFQPNLTRLLESIPSNCGGRFEDLRADGVPEFLTCDDRWAYRYCPYAMSPLPLVVLEYRMGQGYVNASASYPEKYTEETARLLALAETAPSNQDAFDGTSKCAVLHLVLNLLYQGDAQSAWTAFDQYYTYPDAAEFRADIEQVLSETYYP